MAGFIALFVHLTITISNAYLDQFQCTKISVCFVLLDTLFLSRKQLQYGQNPKNQYQNKHSTWWLSMSMFGNEYTTLSKFMQISWRFFKSRKWWCRINVVYFRLPVTVWRLLIGGDFNVSWFSIRDKVIVQRAGSFQFLLC